MIGCRLSVVPYKKAMLRRFFLLNPGDFSQRLFWFRNMLTRVLIHFDWFQFRREKGEGEIDDCLSCSIHFDLISSRPSIFNTKKYIFCGLLKIPILYENVETIPNCQLTFSEGFLNLTIFNIITSSCVDYSSKNNNLQQATSEPRILNQVKD